ncbi:hypothetical protein SAMN04488057_107165 [Cyclobacterium lianum]|uniref:Uncharacterized protein n=1 Tax=Cyclobacterium lianum TaxID=388280 RepID=A0A1M7P9T3_9BACT|nr:hypothetical protein SAMN04488057_107165 [Cyclobacterium lianum]
MRNAQQDNPGGEFIREINLYRSDRYTSHWDQHSCLWWGISLPLGMK